MLLMLAIIGLPDLYLFSKVVPNTFWTKYFPLPFGAGWFVTFLIVIPAVWFNQKIPVAIKGSMASVLLSILVAVPISEYIFGSKLTFNSVFNQYLWVGLICMPPLILQIVLRWFLLSVIGAWLTSRSS